MSPTGSRIDRVRVVAPAGTHAAALAPRLKQVLGHWLDAAEGQRHDLPADAIVLVRQVKASWRSVQQAARQPGSGPSLHNALHSAMHSAQHGLPLSGAPVGAGCPAVWFGNEAEVLAGLARDTLSGSLAQRWWWRQLVGSHVHDEVVQRRWVASPRHVPLALSLLHTDQQDTPWLRHMDEACRAAMLQALASAFPIDPAVLAWVRHGPALGPELREGAPLADDADAALRLARLCAALAHRPQDAAHAAQGAGFLAGHTQALRLTPDAQQRAGGPGDPRAPDAPDTAHGAGTPASTGPKTATPADPRDAHALGNTPPSQARHGEPGLADANAHHATDGHTWPGRMGPARDRAPDQTQPQPPMPAHTPLHTPVHRPTLAVSDGNATHAPARTGSATDTLGRTGPRAPAPSPDAADKADPTCPVDPTPNPAALANAPSQPPGPRAAHAPARTVAASAPPQAASRIDTPHAGLFFLLNAAIGLGWYGDFSQPQHPGLDASPWQFLRAAGQALLGRGWRDDPLHGWLMAMDPSPVPHAPLRPLWPPLRARLALAMGLPRAQAVQLTLCLPGQVRLRPGRVDVHAALAQLPLAVRMAGLDRDVGWLPSAGLDIRFHFEAGTP